MLIGPRTARPHGGNGFVPQRRPPPAFRPSPSRVWWAPSCSSPRNHGLPLEALAYDVTPVGLHYLLVHYDIPAVDAETWRLRIGGRVRGEVELSLEDLRAPPCRP
jgi:hypothetical protein